MAFRLGWTCTFLPCSLTEARLPCDVRSTIKALVKVMNSWTLNKPKHECYCWSSTPVLSGNIIYTELCIASTMFLLACSLLSTNRKWGPIKSNTLCFIGQMLLCSVRHTWSAERSWRRRGHRPLWGDWLWSLLYGWCWGCRASCCSRISSGQSVRANTITQPR